MIKVICFSLVFCVLLNGFSFVLRDKTNSEFISGFENEPTNSLDVIFLGSSMSYRHVYPLDLWHDYGITSYNLGTSEQTIPMSYYLLQYALEKQNPKVIVLDIGMCTIENKKFSDARLHQIWDNLSWSYPKCKSVFDLAEDPETFYFELLLYHTRWKKITISDFLQQTDNYKGAGFYLQTMPFEDVEILDKTVKEKPPEVVMEYLQKIITLCKDNNIKLVLTGMPTYKDSQYRQKLFNYIENFAEIENIDFVNFYFLMDELGLNWKSDFADKMHLNFLAAQRVTKYLGEYLKENYTLSDHRDEVKYMSWNDAWNKYQRNYMRILGD